MERISRMLLSWWQSRAARQTKSSRSSRRPVEALGGLLAALLWLVPVSAHGQETSSSADPPADNPGRADPTPSAPWHLFQGLQACTTWLPGGGRDGLGVTEAELSMVFGVPLPGDWAPIKITPDFVARLWDGPDSAVGGRPDLPPQV